MNNASIPSVVFYGAAHTVTGSMHLLEADDRKFLLDCGLYQGRRAEARERNCCFPFSPAEISAVLLSHAHIDHSGNLPNLVRQGFRGPIYCTPATRDLIAIMLADSAKIQEEDAEFLNRHHERGQPRIEPLYDRGDAHRTMGLVHSIPYERTFNVAGRSLDARFVDAGHVLGSAMIHVTIRDRGADSARSLTFTGDVGRAGIPILRDPAPIPPADLVICESTYGGRQHPPAGKLAEGLAEVVRRTLDRGGKLLIPAFALERTQLIVFFLHQLIQDGRLPEIPIFVDSPLATDATEVFRLHPECFDEETIRLLEEDPDVFGQRRVHYLRSVEESRRLNGRKEPCVIIAASGMCENGRILHHLAHNIEDPRCTILLVGYAAPNTLGRRILDRQPEVKIHDHIYKLRAEVVAMSGFSSHADHDELLAMLKPLAGQVKKVRLVHGEEPQATALGEALRQAGFQDVAYPERGERVNV